MVSNSGPLVLKRVFVTPINCHWWPLPVPGMSTTGILKPNFKCLKFSYARVHHWLTHPTSIPGWCWHPPWMECMRSKTLPCRSFGRSSFNYAWEYRYNVVKSVAPWPDLGWCALQTGYVNMSFLYEFCFPALLSVGLHSGPRNWLIFCLFK